MKLSGLTDDRKRLVRAVRKLTADVCDLLNQAEELFEKAVRAEQEGRLLEAAEFLAQAISKEFVARAKDWACHQHFCKAHGVDMTEEEHDGCHGRW